MWDKIFMELYCMFDIRDSLIQGKGLFATEDIKQGSKICDYYGEEMTYNEFKDRYGKYSENSLYTYPMRRIWKIIVAKEEPYKSDNPVNYINESSEPNSILRSRSLYAVKDILKDEEILLQYPKDYNRVWRIPKTDS
jgi:SET domain-containing protein